jgi:hypothetical protein
MQKGNIHIVLTILLMVLVFAGAIGVVVWRKNIPQPDLGKKACTLEAKVCPDGTSVGRSGPNCEFVVCPSVKPSPSGLLPTQTPEEQKKILPLTDTTNWKIYTSTKYRYTLNHPSNWVEQIRCEGGTAEDDYICIKSSDIEEGPSGVLEGGLKKGSLIWIDGKEGGFLANIPLSTFCKSDTLQQISDCKQTKISNHDAWERVFNTLGKQIVLLNDQKIVLSIWIFYNPQSISESNNISNQILSTIKFN